MRRIVFLALSVGAVLGGRKVWQHQLEVVAAEKDLATQRRGLAGAEAELDALDRSIDSSEARLRALTGELDAIERRHPNGIPQSLYPDYSNLVARHNEAVSEHNALVARHDALRGGYTQRVERHNARVDDANGLAAEATPCGLLPGWIGSRVCGR